MVSIYKNNNVNNVESGEKELEFRGLSTDEKPFTVGGKTIANGSVFIEIDTGKIYFFDIDSETWKEA